MARTRLLTWGGGSLGLIVTYLQHVVESSQHVVLEQDRAVTVGLEVYPHVILIRLVVNELNPGLGHRDANAVRLKVPAAAEGPGQGGKGKV